MRRTTSFPLCALCCALLLTLVFSALFAAVAEEETYDVLGDELPMLVNKDHPVAEDFAPADLVLLSEVLDTSLVKIKYKNTMAVRAAAEALEVMLEAAKEDGIKNWQINAAYRSIADQKKILDNKIKGYMKNSGLSRAKAKARALRTVAEPGCSEHHLGLAFDITAKGASAFKGTKQYKWLNANCWDYGFVIRYQADKTEITGFDAEEWHIRYVGKEHALAMKKANYCLEEYLESLQAKPQPAGFLVDDDEEDINFEDLIPE
jgi:LAS superfamily LD-carboxypeptidase LdcB